MKFLLLILVIFQFVGKVEAIQLENNALERLAEKNRLADLHSAKISVEDFHVVTYLAPNGKRVEVRAISAVPTHEPTEAPSEEPSEEPTEEPTNVPSNRPSSRPSNFPSTIPSSRPSSQPSSRPSRRPRPDVQMFLSVFSGLNEAGVS
eukprot:gene12198-13337_t